MKKTALHSVAGLVALVGLTLPIAPASADDNSGLDVAVFTYDGGGSPDRSATYTPCQNAWTHIENIDSDFDTLGTVAGCSPDRVIVHYTGFVTFPDTGSYSFTGQADDGFTLTLDGTSIIDEWVDKGRGGGTYTDIAIQGGHPYVLDSWFYENGGGANVTLSYMLQGRDTSWITIPQAFFSTSPKTFQVSFDTEGGEAINPVTFNFGDDALTLPTPTKDGFVFSGWAKDSLDGLIIDTETYTPDAAVKLHAVWTQFIQDQVKRTLAETGFSPWPIGLFAMVLVAGGLVVIRKTKRS